MSSVMEVTPRRVSRMSMLEQDSGLNAALQEHERKAKERAANRERLVALYGTQYAQPKVTLPAEEPITPRRSRFGGSIRSSSPAGKSPAKPASPVASSKSYASPAKATDDFETEQDENSLTPIANRQPASMVDFTSLLHQHIPLDEKEFVDALKLVFDQSTPARPAVVEKAAPAPAPVAAARPVSHRFSRQVTNSTAEHGSTTVEAATLDTSKFAYRVEAALNSSEVNAASIQALLSDVQRKTNRLMDFETGILPVLRGTEKVSGDVESAKIELVRIRSNLFRLAKLQNDLNQRLSKPTTLPTIVNPGSLALESIVLHPAMLTRTAPGTRVFCVLSSRTETFSTDAIDLLDRSALTINANVVFSHVSSNFEVAVEVFAIVPSAPVKVSTPTKLKNALGFGNRPSRSATRSENGAASWSLPNIHYLGATSFWHSPATIAGSSQMLQLTLKDNAPQLITTDIEVRGRIYLQEHAGAKTTGFLVVQTGGELSGPRYYSRLDGTQLRCWRNPETFARSDEPLAEWNLATADSVHKSTGNENPGRQNSMTVQFQGQDTPTFFVTDTSADFTIWLSSISLSIREYNDWHSFSSSSSSGMGSRTSSVSLF
ncbi:hypothetical protein CAOG_07071 [Capsaspora owczarzaki ATCC 30864]|uniref:Anillin homology domain-containing protein n=1 Tax=Capsaspora owczarzaki (strain ATCC 30864) TaxID=595528 RepID=A0A0D2WWD8_CAPO3|nr:hypothetical protein CAOG_07071 [Capsaspora owczarzaki ATCC 30864]KJE96803.1 hypothetical protein CAOG_007071 [Capsaspora owczarzaki ATCC 30864]|eukprot:XP_004343795.1 hypothetical protein CAOG_07071 [Capsaspora owczarzaki ATCC 30864]